MIRIFQDIEISHLHEMIQTTIEVSYAAYYPERAVHFFKNYHSEASIAKRHQTGRLLVLESESKIMATGSLVENEISGVFVLPCLQRMGYGKRIMLELEAIAGEKGLNEILLHVSLPSRRFYELLNYQISKPQHIDVGEGQSLRYFQGKKKIAAQS